jgi:plastocyanin
MRRGLRRRTLLLGLGALVVVACQAGPPAGAPVETDRVLMPPSYRFDPPVIRVRAGTTVTWENRDHFPHTVTLLDGSADLVVQPGQSASLTFDRPGDYPYTCRFHRQAMNGRVIVVSR